MVRVQGSYKEWSGNLVLSVMGLLPSLCSHVCGVVGLGVGNEGASRATHIRFLVEGPVTGAVTYGTQR